MGGVCVSVRVSVCTCVGVDESLSWEQPPSTRGFLSLGQSPKPGAFGDCEGVEARSHRGLLCAALPGPKSKSRAWMRGGGLIDSASLSTPLPCIPSALSCRSGAPQIPLGQGPQCLHLGLPQPCDVGMAVPVPEAQAECTTRWSHRAPGHPGPLHLGATRAAHTEEMAPIASPGAGGWRDCMGDRRPALPCSREGTNCSKSRRLRRDGARILPVFGNDPPGRAAPSLPPPNPATCGKVWRRQCCAGFTLLVMYVSIHNYIPAVTRCHKLGGLKKTHIF